MYSNSRGILYTTPPTTDEDTDEPADETAEATEEVTADANPEDPTVTEANANWTGDLAADD